MLRKIGGRFLLCFIALSILFSESNNTIKIRIKGHFRERLRQALTKPDSLIAWREQCLKEIAEWERELYHYT